MISFPAEKVVFCEDLIDELIFPWRVRRFTRIDTATIVAGWLETIRGASALNIYVFLATAYSLRRTTS